MNLPLFQVRVMEHPFILAGSMLMSAPLVRLTLASFLPVLAENPVKDPGWLLLGPSRDFTGATWSLTWLPVYLLVCAVHMAFVYNVALWFLL